MGLRPQLQTLLEETVGSGKNVYFQPPTNLQISYPCLVYARSSTISRFANDKPYFHRRRYQLTYISRDPDDEVNDKLLRLPSCTHTSSFRNDGLYHDIYNLYF